MKRALLFVCLMTCALMGFGVASVIYAASTEQYDNASVQTFLGGPTATPTQCAVTYSCTITPGATIVPGTIDTGNHTDDGVTNIILPFPFTLYGTSYNSVNLSSNGNAQFVSTNPEFNNVCLPFTAMGPTIFAYWEDLVTIGTNCDGDCGIYTSVSGSAPNRIFNIEWRTFYFSNPGNAYFEIRLYEGTPSRFEVILGEINTGGTATIGVQNGGGGFTQCVCNTPPTPNSGITFTVSGCVTPSATPAVTNTPASSTTPLATATRTFTPLGTPTGGMTITYTATRTPTITVTGTPPATFTPQPSATTVVTNTSTSSPVPGTPTATPTLCLITFSDVVPSDYFYESVMYLACSGVISGYGDGTFRPYNNTTRSQMCKIVVLAEGWTLECPAEPNFSDVTPDNPFYCHIETAYANGIIAGYSDGTFRPGNNVTRGQTCKIVVLAEEWTLECLAPPTFTDVPADHPFFCYIEVAYAHEIISGYSDGTFRPGNDVTRGQLSKIVYTAVKQP